MFILFPYSFPIKRRRRLKRLWWKRRESFHNEQFHPWPQCFQFYLVITFLFMDKICLPRYFQSRLLQFFSYVGKGYHAIRANLYETCDRGKDIFLERFISLRFYTWMNANRELGVENAIRNKHWWTFLPHTSEVTEIRYMGKKDQWQNMIYNLHMLLALPFCI